MYIRRGTSYEAYICLCVIVSCRGIEAQSAMWHIEYIECELPIYIYIGRETSYVAYICLCVIASCRGIEAQRLLFFFPLRYMTHKDRCILHLMYSTVRGTSQCEGPLMYAT